MSVLRRRSLKDVDSLQNFGIIEISSNGSNLPLQNENWSQRWCTVPSYFEKIYKEIYQFPVREDDVFVVTFPRSGTTWTQEATWLLVNDLNFEKAKECSLKQRSVFMDLSGMHADFPVNTVEAAKEEKSPRVLKSHLPAHLIPREIWDKKAKIIYCARNPKDMAVSFYHFQRGLGKWEGDLNDYVEHLIQNNIMYSPYWQHVMDFWQMREEPNICFITYEDMKRDLKKVLIKINKFLEKPELTEKNLEKLVQHLTFDNLRVNQFVNPTDIIKSQKSYDGVKQDFQFMRRGIVGSFKDELSPELDAKLNQWINENLKNYQIQLQDIFGNL